MGSLQIVLAHQPVKAKLPAANSASETRWLAFASGDDDNAFLSCEKITAVYERMCFAGRVNDRGQTGCRTFEGQTL